MEGLDTFGPLAGECEIVRSGGFVTRTTRVISSHFKTSCIYKAIKFVFNTVSHNALRCDSLNAKTTSINQRHVWSVEGWQVVVMEARTLAELAIPRLQRFRCCRIFHNFINTCAHLIHFFKVCIFNNGADLFKTCSETAFFARTQHEVANNFSPTVIYEIFSIKYSRREICKVFIAATLPTWL